MNEEDRVAGGIIRLGHIRPCVPRLSTPTSIRCSTKTVVLETVQEGNLPNLLEDRNSAGLTSRVL